jgi:Tfp pilus assembly protein FimT
LQIANQLQKLLQVLQRFHRRGRRDHREKRKFMFFSAFSAYSAVKNKPGTEVAITLVARHKMVSQSGEYKGFSLLEALVIVTVVGVIVAGGIPTFYRLLQKYRLEGEARQILGTVALTRLRATSSNFTYSFQYDRSKDSYLAAGVEPAAPDGNWYPAYCDLNGNGVQDTDSLNRTVVTLQHGKFETTGLFTILPSGADPDDVPVGQVTMMFGRNGTLVNTPAEERCIVLQNSHEMRRAVCVEPGGIIGLYNGDEGTWQQIQ